MVKDSIIPNHMDVYWHDYTGHVKDRPITETSVPVKAALIGRVSGSCSCPAGPAHGASATP